jgi:hypothetical protein
MFTGVEMSQITSRIFLSAEDTLFKLDFFVPYVRLKVYIGPVMRPSQFVFAGR